MAIGENIWSTLRCSLRSNQSKLGLPQKKDTTQSTLRQCWEQSVSCLLRVEVLKTFHPEKKLMPMIVLTASIIYVGIAATFYFDVIWTLTKLKRELNYFCSCSLHNCTLHKKSQKIVTLFCTLASHDISCNNKINRQWHLLILTCVPFQYVPRFVPVCLLNSTFAA